MVRGVKLTCCAPYVYSDYPEDGPDAFESLVVTSPRVELRDEPGGRCHCSARIQHCEGR